MNKQELKQNQADILKEELKKKMNGAKTLADIENIQDMLEKQAESLFMLETSEERYKSLTEKYLNDVIKKTELGHIQILKKLAGLDLNQQAKILKTRIKHKELQIRKAEVCIEVLNEELKKIGGK